MNQVGVLYISYDGMLEPLGQSQVLAYLKQLALDRKIHLLSYEKSVDWNNTIERDDVKRDIACSGIVWHTLRYHKSPSALATAWDILCGTILALWLVVRYRLRIVHARSYVPSVIALLLKRITRVKYLFDMRGFWADEKVDGGTWSQLSFMYLIAKKFEKQFLMEADEVVSLTKAGRNEITQFNYLQGRVPPITVIPTCADLVHFSPFGLNLEINKKSRFVLGYVGSVGTVYMFEEVAKCFAQLLLMRPTAHFLIVNRGQHNYIKEKLYSVGVPKTSFRITSASYSEVPSKILKMDAGVFFIKPTFSKRASAPTKLAEMLGCGIPCLTNFGVGDMAEVLQGDNVGVVIKEFDPVSLKLGLERLFCLLNETDIQERCISAAKQHFSLEEGIARYRNIYERLVN